MPHTLLLRLAGPMQSWGISSRFKIRDTGLEPSKSGVIGLLCAALGKPRDELHPDNADKPTLQTLAALKMGVRVNREGVMKKDFHTAGGIHGKGKEYGVAKAGGGTPDTVTSERFYLSDADFLVGLESDDEQEQLLRDLNQALAHPRWQIFLGRKAFVPARPVYLPNEEGLRLNTALDDALLFDWPADRAKEELRFVVEVDAAHLLAQERRDVPLIFISAERDHGKRYVATEFKKLPTKGEPEHVFLKTEPESAQP